MRMDSRTPEVSHEGVKENAENIKPGHARGKNGNGPEQNISHIRMIGIHDDRFLAVVPAGQGKSGQGQGTDQKGDMREGHGDSQAAHLTDILLPPDSVDNAARAQK